MRPYDLAKSIFLQALERPADEREPFIAGECDGDPALLREVRELLAYHDDTLAGLEPGEDESARPDRVGPYGVLDVLGRGGMGVVYLAQREGQPPVALKLLREGLLSPTLLARFRREAEALARLDHPGIARAIETGVESGPSGPRPWLAMERVEGVDLRAWARTERSLAERLELLARIADAVEHAHRNDVVHRDLKPENVFVRADGQPVVLDFGVARITDSDVRATTLMTSAGLIVGTIRYMSPEQAEARPGGIGPPSDVYSLAVLAYELLAGRLPYEVPEHSVHRALVAVMTATPRPLHELPAPLRGRLERVLRAALAKDPERRTASAGEFADDLRRVASGRRPLARPPREGAGRTAAGWRLVLALGSGALLLGFALSSWRTPSRSADWFEGMLRPRRMYDRVMGALDSATVRLHFTTRTLAREREALVFARRARMLLRTIGWRPYAARVERLALYREAESEYLIAERTNEVARFEAAARLWYEAREPRFPREEIPLPDTLGLSASALCSEPTPGAWLAASMSLADAARIERPGALFTRSLALAADGARDFARLEASVRPGDPVREPFVRWLRPHFEGRLGVALVGYGLHTGKLDTLQAGLDRLRTAVALAQDEVDLSGVASHLHELGAGEARLARITGRREPLDSAIAHLSRAYAIREGLDGYTSRYLSRLELANAERLMARMDQVSAGRHVAAAESLLALPAADRAMLGRIDALLFDIGAVAAGLDRCCVRRDTSAFPALESRLARITVSIARTRMPLVLAEAEAQQARLEGLRYALTGDLRARRTGHQVIELTLLAQERVGSARLTARLGAGLEAFTHSPRAYDLDYPLPEPF